MPLILLINQIPRQDMADNIKIAEIVSLGKRRGYIKPKDEADICLSDYINTANYLLFLLERAEEMGLSTSQIVARSGLNANTCKLYLRQLMLLGLIRKHHEIQNLEAIWIFKNRKEQNE
jgi:hypothetical protein